MTRMRELLANFRNQVKALWGRMPRPTRIASVIAVVILVIAVLVFAGTKMAGIATETVLVTMPPAVTTNVTDNQSPKMAELSATIAQLQAEIASLRKTPPQVVVDVPKQPASVINVTVPPPPQPEVKIVYVTNNTSGVQVPSANLTRPVVNLEPEVKVAEGKPVTFAAEAHSQAGEQVTVYWIADSSNPVNGTFSTISASRVTFTAPAVNTDTTLKYTLLGVVDSGASASAKVSILVQNVDGGGGPAAGNGGIKAFAGVDTTLIAGTFYFLGGEGKSPDNRTLYYNWTISGGTLSIYNAPMPLFTAPVVNQETVITLTLTVSDRDGNSASDTVVITVKPRPTN